MSCPTCSGTMQGVCSGAEGVVLLFHCSRCGTIQDNRPGSNQVCVPALVDRCRRFIEGNTSDPAVDRMRRLGILESVNLPGERGEYNND